MDHVAHYALEYLEIVCGVSFTLLHGPSIHLDSVFGSEVKVRNLASGIGTLVAMATGVGALVLLETR